MLNLYFRYNTFIISLLYIYSNFKYMVFMGDFSE